ncbi:MAG: hypothetical protein ACHQHP_06515 [Bacteroidia bacterium]
MNSNQINLKQILPTVLIFGLLGRALLIGTDFLISKHLFFEKGWWMILDYPLVMFPAMWVLKAHRKIELTYLKTFITGVLIFMLMTTISYIYACMCMDNRLTLGEHIRRFLVMLVFALASGAILGLFFRKRNMASSQ